MFVGILWGCLGFTLGGESWARCSRCEVSTAHVAAEFSGPKHWPQKSHHCPTGCPLNRVRIKAMSSSHGAAGVGGGAGGGAGVEVPDGPWYLDKFQEKPNHRSQGALLLHGPVDWTWSWDKEWGPLVWIHLLHDEGQLPDRGRDHAALAHIHAPTVPARWRWSAGPGGAQGGAEWCMPEVSTEFSSLQGGRFPRHRLQGWQADESTRTYRQDRHRSPGGHQGRWSATLSWPSSPSGAKGNLGEPMRSFQRNRDHGVSSSSEGQNPTGSAFASSRVPKAHGSFATGTNYGFGDARDRGRAALGRPEVLRVHESQDEWSVISDDEV